MLSTASTEATERNITCNKILRLGIDSVVLPTAQNRKVALFFTSLAIFVRSEVTNDYYGYEQILQKKNHEVTVLA